MPHFLIRFNIHSSTHDLDLQILCDKIQTFYKIKNEVDKSQLYFQFFKIKSVSFISLQKHIENNSLNMFTLILLKVRHCFHVNTDAKVSKQPF